MSDEKLSSPSFTEKLVAYLDGELPDGAAREVEQRLSSDPAMRSEVEKLNRAWELLDLLPRPTASGEFSSRTLATLQVVDGTTELAAEPDASATMALETSSGRRFPIPPLVAWSAGLVMVSVLGFAVGRMTARPSTDIWLDDFTLIEHIDVYREIGDVEFLRDLKQRGVLDERRPPESR
jgi:anti-sigma factor RsiW